MLQFKQRSSGIFFPKCVEFELEIIVQCNFRTHTGDRQRNPDFGSFWNLEGSDFGSYTLLTMIIVLTIITILASYSIRTIASIIAFLIVTRTTVSTYTRCFFTLVNIYKKYSKNTTCLIFFFRKLSVSPFLNIKIFPNSFLFLKGLVLFY